MHITIIALWLTVAVSANPFAWVAPRAGTTSTRRRHHHFKEPTPTFKLSCNCKTPVIPINLLNPGEKCLMEHAAAMGCYLGSKGACPSPAPACGLAPLNVIPFGP